MFLSFEYHLEKNFEYFVSLQLLLYNYARYKRIWFVRNKQIHMKNI